MTDVTEFVQRYRFVLRYIWNSCFWAVPSLRNWDSVDALRDLKLPLFRAIVADPLDLGRRDGVFGADFRVVPDVEFGGFIPLLQVNSRVPSRPETESCVWEAMQGPFKEGEIEMTLVDLFDWSPLRYLDLRYYMVLIESFPKYPEKVGQHALVDVTYARVFWAPASHTGEASGDGGDLSDSVPRTP